MSGVAAAWGLEVDAVIEEREAEGVTLAVEELDEYGGSIDREGEFVWGLDVVVPLEREEHGIAMVEEQLATEVGLFFELFDKESVGASEEAPVNMACVFACVVMSVVGELCGKAVEGAAVTASDESLNDLSCKEI